MKALAARQACAEARLGEGLPDCWLDTAAAVRRHRGWAPCPGDLAHLPGTQPHHTVFSPGFLDIKKSERYTKTSSRIGASYYKK